MLAEHDGRSAAGLLESSCEVVVASLSRAARLVTWQRRRGLGRCPSASDDFAQVGTLIGASS